MLRIDRPVIVEGKYDKERLGRVIDAVILTTDGFGIFKKEEKKLLIRRLCADRGVIVLTDPDGAGLVIRNFLRGILPADRVIHLYIPRLAGKEKRKAAPSKEGVLGVEGMEEKTLEQLFLPFASAPGSVPQSGAAVTKARFYADGFSGSADSAARRKALAKQCALPDNLGANALLEAINLLGGVPYYEEALRKIQHHEDANEESTEAFT